MTKREVQAHQMQEYLMAEKEKFDRDWSRLRQARDRDEEYLSMEHKLKEMSEILEAEADKR